MNSSHLYFPISAAVNAVTSIVLGIYILFTSFRKPTARYLFYFCFTVFAWSCAYFLWQVSKDSSSALFWARGLMFGAIFAAISYFHLVTVFLNLNKQLFYKRTLLVFYFFAFVWVVANFTPLLVAGVAPRSYFKFWPLPGTLYLPYLFFFFSNVVLASVLLYQKYRNSKGPKRMQAALLLIGICIAFIAGSTNYFLWYNVNIPPWGNGAVALYVLITVYAITKYKFLDIRAVSAELFTAIFFIILVSDVFLSKSAPELIFRAVSLVVMVVFGAMLIRSVRREVRRREEITRLAHSLEQANLRLQELDQQKTEFLSIASHQLRTPLSIIKGYIELLKDGGYGKVTKETVGALNNMDTSNERLVRLIDEYLDVSRIEQGRTKYDFAPKDLNAVIDGVTQELKERAGQKGLRLIWSPVKNGPVVIDEEKIRHVVFNFIDNAIKYSEEGQIKVVARQEDDGIAVRVKDNGIGFDKVDEINFFQKFYRGNNVKGVEIGGTGLGIFVCKKFIEAHGGHVWAHSPGLGKGSEFGFWIPVRASDSVTQ